MKNAKNTGTKPYNSIEYFLDTYCLNPSYCEEKLSIDELKNFSFFDLDMVKAFFNGFTMEKNKYGEPFLSVQQLDMFIDKAFKGNKNLEKIKFNAGYGDQNKIVYLFYLFYRFALQIETASKRNNLKLKYQKLLIDNCTGFGEESHVMKNFHKSPKINPWKFEPNDSANAIIIKCQS